jgi:hypothetical protein
MTMTVDIQTINAQGELETVIHCDTVSMKAALRIVDGATPAPVNRHVRRRLYREHGGSVQIGMVRADIAVYA